MRGQHIIAPLNETLSSAETVLISMLEFTSSSLTRKSATQVSPDELRGANRARRSAPFYFQSIDRSCGTFTNRVESRRGYWPGPVQLPGSACGIAVRYV